MQFKEDKIRFRRSMVAFGADNLDQLTTLDPEVKQMVEIVGRKRMLQWEAQMLQGASVRKGRLVNHFKLGADPEFVMARPLPDGGSHRQAAMECGLHTGLAFGADLNGRLVELRAAPSRSALTVVASILETLRWMTATRADLVLHQWLAGAYAHGDGLGGHVHFGRKAASRDREVVALDLLTGLLERANILPQPECIARRKATPYGRYGDVRFQAHGFEYRTLPSWLDSPWLAFLILTLAKLVVYNPAMVLEGKARYATIRNTLAYFRGLDDDSALALEVLQKWGPPTHYGGDFKKRWGLQHIPKSTSPVNIVPAVIKAPDSVIVELTESLVQNMPPTNLSWAAKPSWKADLPRGYVSVLLETETARLTGMGELLRDAVMRNDFPLVIRPETNSSNAMFKVSAGWLGLDWGKRLLTFLHQAGCLVSGSLPLFRMLSDARAERYLYIGTSWRQEPALNWTRAALYSGVFPIWRASEVREDSFQKWCERNAAPPPTVKKDRSLLIGQV